MTRASLAHSKFHIGIGTFSSRSRDNLVPAVRSTRLPVANLKIQTKNLSTCRYSTKPTLTTTSVVMEPLEKELPREDLGLRLDRNLIFSYAWFEGDSQSSKTVTKP